VVTVLFADITGSTALAERLDPEQTRAILARFFKAMTEVITGHGGTVEKFVGDEVMAVFGLPAVHEDDPERAIRAAGAMHARLQALNAELEASGGIVLQMRIGINTGEVVASPHASQIGEFMVTGDAVNVAARLRSAADPGATLVGESTYRDTTGLADYRPLPPLAVKGKTAPVTAWSLVGLPHSRRRPRAGGVRAPMIGRDEELALLQGLLRRVIRERRPYLVTIIGPPGVGKTRLFEELQASLPPSVAVRQDRCLPYGSAALWPVAEIVRADCGILTTDPLPVMTRKLEDRINELAGEGREARPLARHLARLLGIPAQGPGAAQDGSREDLFWALRRYFERVAAGSPLVLGFEDIHWGDAELLDFIEDLARRSAGVPLFILCLARPDLLEAKPGWGGGERNYASLFLEPLDGVNTQRLLRGLLQADNLPSAISDAVGVAEGNPFFVEEILRMLIDTGVLRRAGDRWETSGAVDAAMPDTVQGVIAARLDRLHPDEKAAIQVASIIGKVFWADPLAHLTGLAEPALAALLHTLQAKDLIVEDDGSTLEGQREFAFKHILIRDVAYATVPKATRCRKHRAFAVWLERTLGERAREYGEILAHHWLRAARLGQEIGLGHEWHAGAPKALEYSLAAGRKAARVYAHDQARTHLETARTVASQLGADSERIAAIEGLADVHALQAQWEQAAGLYQEALDYYLKQGDAIRQAHVRSRIGSAYSGVFDFRQALPHIQSAMETLREERGEQDLAGVYLQMSRAQLQLENLAGAEEYVRQGLGLAEKHNLRPQVAEGNAVLGLIYTLRGRPDAPAYYTRCIEIAEQLGDLGRAIPAYSGLGLHHSARGTYPQAGELYERTLAAAQESHNRPRIAFARYRIGGLHFLTGNWAAAAAAWREYLAMSEEVPSWAEQTKSMLAFVEGDLPKALGAAPKAIAQSEKRRELTGLGHAFDWCAFLYLRLGRPDDARSILEQALARFTPLGIFWAAYLHPLAAEAALALGDPERAAEHCRLADAPEWKAFTPARARTLKVRGLLHLARHEWENAVARIQDASDLYRTIGQPYDLALCLEALAETYGRRGHEGDRARAEEALHEAIKVYRQLGAEFEVQRIQPPDGTGKVPP